jgi:hypothetical protein
MSTTKTPTEWKAGGPSTFSGDTNDATRWMYSVLSYVAVNPTIYDTDMKKIILALSYMKEGTAAIWAQNFYEEAYSSGTPAFGTDKDFWIEFKKSFGSVDQKITAITKLKHLTQGNSITEYIAEFKTLAVQSTIKQDVALIHFFESGLKPGLAKSIYLKESVPDTIDKWYTAAIQMDANYQRSKALNKDKTPKTYKPSGNRFIPHPKVNRDPNAMDIDHLNEAERKEYMQKGKCFRCGQTGHRANDPEFHPKKKTVRRQEIEEESDEGEEELRRIQKDF